MNCAPISKNVFTCAEEWVVRYPSSSSSASSSPSSSLLAGLVAVAGCRWMTGLAMATADGGRPWINYAIKCSFDVHAHLLTFYLVCGGAALFLVGIALLWGPADDGRRLVHIAAATVVVVHLDDHQAAVRDRRRWAAKRV